MNAGKTILILCEESGAFANLYREAGYNVVVVDEKLNGGDARLLPYLKTGVYGLLAFPPCTHLAGSGARWWQEKGTTALVKALSIADSAMRMVALYKPAFWVIENPVGRLSRYYGKPRYTFHPYEFAGYTGDTEEAYSKRTCLWGQFRIPKKRPMENIHGSKMWSKYGGNSERTKELRSKTPIGFAKAFFLHNQ